MNRDGTRRLDRHAATRIVKRLSRRAGIDKTISPHSLRQSFITAALDAGVAPRDVPKAASHADPRTTMRYDRARRSLDHQNTSRNALSRNCEVSASLSGRVLSRGRWLGFSLCRRWVHGSGTR